MAASGEVPGTAAAAASARTRRACSTEATPGRVMAAPAPVTRRRRGAGCSERTLCGCFGFCEGQFSHYSPKLTQLSANHHLPWRRKAQCPDGDTAARGLEGDVNAVNKLTQRTPATK